MRKVVVLGGTGWGGHHIVPDQQKHGYDCIVASHGRKSEDYAITADAIGRKLNVEYVPLDELLIRRPANPFGSKFFAKHICFTIDKAKKYINHIPEHGEEETIAETARLTAIKFK